MGVRAGQEPLLTGARRLGLPCGRHSRLSQEFEWNPQGKQKSNILNRPEEEVFLGNLRM
uniref:Uncharacterized protein n=1 Tax=Arion vulgaris TaxID=1028688 RepID=A0A0B7AX45_9EUPU